MEKISDFIAKKFIDAVSYTTLSTLVTRFFGIFLTVFIVRCLQSDLLGIYLLVQSTIGLFSTFISCGISLTATKMMAQYRLNDTKKASQIFALLLICLLFSVTIGLIIYWFSLKSFTSYVAKEQELLYYLRLGLAWLVTISLIQFYESLLIGLQSFKKLMVIQSIFSALNLLIVLISLLLIKSDILFAIIIAQTISSFLQLLIMIVATHNEARIYSIYPSFQGLASLVRPILIDFSFPAFISKLFEQPMSWLSIVLLIKITNNVSLVGQLSIINTIKGWFLYFPTIIASVMIPILTDVYHTQSRETFKKTLVINQRFLWLSTLPVVITLVLFMKEIISLVFGQHYESCWSLAALMLASSILIPVNEVNDRAMVSMNRIWPTNIFRILYFFLFFAFLLFLVPKFNLLGYVISWCFSYFIYVFIQTIWLRGITKDNSFIYLTIFSFLTLTVSIYLAWMTFINKVLFGSILLVSVLLYEYLFILRANEKLILFNQLERTFSFLKKSNSKQK